MDDITHLTVVRFAFALMSLGSVLLFVGVLQELAPHKKSSTALFGFFLLVTSPLFFSQAVKIRSDGLALFLSLWLIYVALKSRLPWTNARFVTVFILSFCLLGSTPRALIHHLIASSLVILFLWPKRKRTSDLRPVFFALLAPYFCTIMILVLSGDGIVGHLVNYYRESFSKSGYDFSLTWGWIRQEWILCSGIVIGLLVALRKRYWAILVPSFMAILGFLSSDLRTPYLIASLLPFFILPFCLCFPWSTDARRWSAALFVTAVVFQGALHPHSWWGSNAAQKEVIEKISQLLKENPNLSYFDGLGLLPRSPQILSYLGPNDEVAIQAALRKISTQRPDLILYTSRTVLLGQQFTDSLIANYRPVGLNLYLRKEIAKDIKVEFSEPPVLLFHLNPLVK